MISKEFFNTKPLISHFVVRDKRAATKSTPALRERRGHDQRSWEVRGLA
jgi:hypothetical protein